MEVTGPHEQTREGPMAESSEHQQEKAAQELSNYVLARMKQGKDKRAIAAEMKEDGVVHEEADRVVGKMYDAILAAARKERFAPDSWQSALLGGLGAAILGGVIWGLVIIYTGFEAGLVAWALGWFCGWAVVKLTGGKKGLQAQAVAIVSSLLGILLGKYIAFYHFLTEAVTEEHGAEAAAEISIFSGAVIEEFFMSIGDMLEPLDFFFVAAAIYTAWSLTRGLGVKAPDTGVPPELLK